MSPSMLLSQLLPDVALAGHDPVLTGLVLDMRYNSGGLLDQGVAVSDLFLEKGDLVVETKGRVPNQNHRLTAVDADEYPGMPLVALVSERSASATEIVAVVITRRSARS